MREVGIAPLIGAAGHLDETPRCGYVAGQRIDFPAAVFTSPLATALVTVPDPPSCVSRYTGLPCCLNTSPGPPLIRLQIARRGTRAPHQVTPAFFSGSPSMFLWRKIPSI